MEIIRTKTFDRWFARMRDKQAQHRIGERLLRLGVGNAGQVRDVGRGVSELKIDFGPGYRVYY